MTTKVPPLTTLNLEIGIIQGRKLVPKDRGALGLGRATSSDPYIEIWLGNHHYGTTRAVKKSLDPYWNETFHISITQPHQVSTFFENGNNVLQLRIFDKDEYSKPDNMGVVSLPIEPDIDTSCLWYRVEKGEGRLHCHNARGELRVQVSATAARVRSVVRGNVCALNRWSAVRVGLGWEMERGRAIDLDASCVAVDRAGRISLSETVYYGNLSTPAIQHSGDEQEGDESIGDAGFDEIITVDFAKMPAHIVALYFVLTVATPNKTLNEIQSAFVRVFETSSQQAPICQFDPARETLATPATALFLVRMARHGTGGWSVRPIGDTDPAARDFGVLAPRIRAYTRDLVPNLQIDPRERLAILKKHHNIRLSDFSSATAVSLGLGWDVTDGVSIDLDASAVCLDQDLNFVEAVWYRKLSSDNSSIVHSGDNRTGAGSGDDETITVELRDIPANIKYVGFVINSFSGQELDDVEQASCHVYKRDSPGVDIATYTLSHTAELDKHTALVLACLHRADDGGGEWCLRIISEAAQGRTVEDNVDELQDFLRRHPPPPPVAVPEEPDIDLSVMPDVVPMEDEEIVIAPLSELVR